MISDRSTQGEILLAMLKRLQAKIPEFAGEVCFISDQPVPSLWPAGNVCCTVCLGGGTFNERMYAGGGVATINKLTSLLVTVWMPTDIESQPALETALVRDRGLYSKWEGEVLRALLLEEDSSGAPQCWMPVGPDGKGMLRSFPAPQDVSAARPDNDGDRIGITISFSLDFDWRLG